MNTFVLVATCVIRNVLRVVENYILPQVKRIETKECCLDLPTVHGYVRAIAVPLGKHGL